MITFEGAIDTNFGRDNREETSFFLLPKLSIPSEVENSTFTQIFYLETSEHDRARIAHLLSSIYNSTSQMMSK